MSTLVHAALTLRRTARASFGPAMAVVFLALPLLGVFSAELGLEHAVLGGSWILFSGVRASGRWAARSKRTETRALDLELGALALAGSHGLVQHFGGLAGPVHPLIYVVVAVGA